MPAEVRGDTGSKVRPRICMKARSLRLGIVAAFMVVTAFNLQVHLHNPPPHLCSMPSQIDDWRGTGPVPDQQTREILAKSSQY